MVESRQRKDKHTDVESGITKRASVSPMVSLDTGERRHVNVKAAGVKSIRVVGKSIWEWSIRVDPESKQSA